MRHHPYSNRAYLNTKTSTSCYPRTYIGAMQMNVLSRCSNHISSICLCATDPKYPDKEWDHFLPEATLKLNLLRNCCFDSKLSAYAALHDIFYYKNTNLPSWNQSNSPEKVHQFLHLGTSWNRQIVHYTVFIAILVCGILYYIYSQHTNRGNRRISSENFPSCQYKFRGLSLSIYQRHYFSLSRPQSY